jgi:hypothetical protein
VLFRVLTERGEKNSVAIASNEPSGGWTKTFTDPRLCAAIVDRLTFNGTIIETGTESYRLARTKPSSKNRASSHSERAGVEPGVQPLVIVWWRSADQTRSWSVTW